MKNSSNTTTPTSASDLDVASEQGTSLEQRLDVLEKKLDQVIQLLHKLAASGEQEKRIHWE